MPSSNDGNSAARLKERPHARHDAERAGNGVGEPAGTGCTGRRVSAEKSGMAGYIRFIALSHRNSTIIFGQPILSYLSLMIKIINKNIDLNRVCITASDFESIQKEFSRQQNHIELIASENIVSRAVLETQGSVLTNKYAEGYSGKRYYGGCEFVDIAEDLAIERVKKLFNCNFANVQPHSGAQANAAVFLALIKPGDTILGMGIDQGGHLTHGAAPAMSGKWFNAIPYGVRKDNGLIDYEAVKDLAIKYKPKLIEYFSNMIFTNDKKKKEFYELYWKTVNPEHWKRMESNKKISNRLGIETEY